MWTTEKSGRIESLRNDFKNNPANQGMNWREYKKKKKEQREKWAKEKKLKKILRDQKREKSQLLEQSALGSSFKGSWYTVSIAVPGSILDNAQTPSLKAHLSANIARSAAIFRVNEIVVYSESSLEKLEDNDEALKLHQKHRGCLQMVRILQFLECPPYLRRYFFPLHKDLEHTGEIHPLQIPSHLGVNDESEYREGVVLDKPVKSGKGSYVHIGLYKTAVIDKVLEQNTRVTVQLDKEQNSKKHYRGKAVSPTAPFKHGNIYWGYNVRLAKSLNAVFKECPYKGGYDLTIGTSDKGKSVDDLEFPKFNHLLIMFGGLKGIEGCLDDESIDVDDASQLFNYYLNICPNQGVTTIRTEEAVIATLATLRPKIFQVQDVTLETS